MSKAVSSALLSGLVFPGAGHLYLKKYRMASLLIIATIACLSFLIIKAVTKATAILDELEASGAAINTYNIMQASARATGNTETTAATIATLLIVVCWFVGVIDAYRSGKRIDDNLG